LVKEVKASWHKVWTVRGSDKRVRLDTTMVSLVRVLMVPDIIVLKEIFLFFFGVTLAIRVLSSFSVTTRRAELIVCPRSFLVP
jgi:hypothetical protein